MPSYLFVKRNGLHLFKSFEDRSVQKPLFQDYFKVNNIAESGDYGKMFHEKY